MIRVYLDWNCITNNCQGFLELAEKYRNDVVFPFTREHIRDLLESIQHKDYYLADLEILQKMCADNFLEIKDDQGFIYKYSPIEYQRLNGWRIRLIQAPFNLILKNNYRMIKGTVLKHFSNEELNIIRNKQTSDIIPYLDTYVVTHNLGTSLEDFANRFVPRCKWLYNTSSRLKSVYFSLDMMGYYSDKKKGKHFNFTNIDIDANHMTNAIHCDYFVTDDSRLFQKAEAIYLRYGCRTKIIWPNNLVDVINNDLSK